MNDIVKWLEKYSKDSGGLKFVVGISGGIDSALTSTLCAATGIETYAVSMPIHQDESQLRRARAHIEWLAGKHANVIALELSLTEAFDAFSRVFGAGLDSPLGLANSRSRLRMTALYQVASSVGGLVVGTGNKVEDFGVGFFTKYGDGGVDLSPIGDLLKSEVYAMARDLGVLPEIIEATPTDGLWGDNRTDEDQLGASYGELEWAMSYYGMIEDDSLSDRQKQVLTIFRKLHEASRHKMEPVPVFRRTRETQESLVDQK